MAVLEKIKEFIEKEEIKLFKYSSFGGLQFLGAGGFGDVFRAYSEDKKEIVALKKVRNEKESFIREVKKINKFNHENIIKFYGITQDDGTQEYYMVLQFANNEDLRGFLHNRFSELDWPTKIKMANEISRGINYLHSENIVHRDLHDKNILVHDGRMIITDFGLSKSLENNSKSIDGGRAAYSAPEFLKNPEYSRDKPSDIYSLGMLFWQLSSGRPPFKNMTTQQIFLHVTYYKRESPINGTPNDFVNLYCEAWNDDPKLRPEISVILHKLDSIQMKSVFHGGSTL
ncbi:6819_t:CDS:2, partial [Dentiscutata heterogama]